MDRIRIGYNDIEGRISEISQTSNPNQMDTISIRMVLRDSMHLAPTNATNSVVVLSPDGTHESLIRNEMRGYVTSVAYHSEAQVSDVYSTPRGHRRELTLSFILDNEARLPSEQIIDVESEDEYPSDEFVETIISQTSDLLSEIRDEKGEENKFTPQRDNRLKHIE